MRESISFSSFAKYLPPVKKQKPSALGRNHTGSNTILQLNSSQFFDQPGPPIHVIAIFSTHASAPISRYLGPII
jgi:hypothetical protein